MKTLAALLLALPLAATAQAIAPPSAPPAPAPLPAAAAVPAPEAPPVAPPPPPRTPYTRDSWYFGAGIGTATGTSSGTGSDAGSLTTMGVGPVSNLILNLKGGATLTPHLLVGLDVTLLRSSSADGGKNALTRITSYDAMVTWFPMERGLLVRGGVGVSTLDWSLFRYSTGGESYWSYGANLAAGAGYAFWLGETFNLTATVDVSAQHWFSPPTTANGSTITDNRMVTLTAGFDWY